MNKMGHSTDIIHLDVTSPPDKPTDLEVYNVTHDSVTLMWKRGFDGGLPTSYQIRWREALDYEDRYHYLDVSPGEYKTTITGLSLGTYYVFSVKAINEKGDSGFLPDLVKVQTLRKSSCPARSNVTLCAVTMMLSRAIRTVMVERNIEIYILTCPRNKLDFT